MENILIFVVVFAVIVAIPYLNVFVRDKLGLWKG